MRIVVVFESLWGNTELIAREIASGLGGAGVAVRRAAAETAIDEDTALLVVGGPTHAFSMSSAGTRESAAKQGATNIPTMGIREWIDAQSAPQRPVRVATFDTRVSVPRLPGSAAKKAMKRLLALGFQPIAKPKTFWVHGYSGPVDDGELERAREWGAELGHRLQGG